MALGFFMGMVKGIGKVLDDKGKVIEVAAKRIPKALKPGQDFNYRASKSGEFRIAEPVSTRSRASNSPRDRQQYTMRRLMEKGWTAPQSAGIVGRFMVEAFPDLRTNAVGDKEIPGASHGIGQWNRERKAAMHAYSTGKPPAGKFQDHPLVMAAARASPGARSVSSLDAQIDFFDWEVRNSPSERIAYASLRRSKTAEDAATSMMHYERPSGYVSKAPSRGMHYDRTVKNAGSVMHQFDPNYQPKVDATGNQQDADVAAMSVRDETGDAIQMEKAQQSQAAGGYETYEDDMIEEEPEEDTSEDTPLVGGEDSPIQDEGPVDTSKSRNFIQGMQEQGQAAAMNGPLQRFSDIFGKPQE